MLASLRSACFCLCDSSVCLDQVVLLFNPICISSPFHVNLTPHSRHLPWRQSYLADRPCTALNVADPCQPFASWHRRCAQGRRVVVTQKPLQTDIPSRSARAVAEQRPLPSHICSHTSVCPCLRPEHGPGTLALLSTGPLSCRPTACRQLRCLLIDGICALPSGGMPIWPPSSPRCSAEQPN